MQLLDKYTPNTLNGFVGNREAIALLNRFGCDVHANKRPKPILVCGPSGTGKTSAVRALAYGNGFELVELTSSDYRDSETLRKKLLPAASTRGLFSKVTLILFDEIDELSKQFDKGAETVILQMLRESKQPIAFTASDYWNQKIVFLRGHVEKVEFKKVSTEDTVSFLKKIAKSEGKQVDDETLRELALRCDGDVRGAINDLELVLQGGGNALEVLGVRNRKLEIFRVLDKIFLSNDFMAAKSSVDNSDVDMDMLINWVEENVPNRFQVKASVNKAYAELAYASRFIGVAERIRYYGYFKYAAIALSAGVAISNRGSAPRYLSPYSFPARVKYYSATKEKRSLQAKIASKLSLYLHTNRKDIIGSYLPLFRQIYEKGSDSEKDMANSFFESLEFDKDELEYLKGAS